MERAHDGDEDGEGRERGELHDWGVRGEGVFGRERLRGGGAGEGILYETGGTSAVFSF